MERELESIITEIRDNSKYIADEFKAKILGVFSSFARNEQTSLSDIDLLVRFFDGASLFDLVRLANFLEEKLQIKVDIVSERAVRSELKERIYNEVISI